MGVQVQLFAFRVASENYITIAFHVEIPLICSTHLLRKRFNLSPARPALQMIKSSSQGNIFLYATFIMKSITILSSALAFMTPALAYLNAYGQSRHDPSAASAAYLMSKSSITVSKSAAATLAPLSIRMGTMLLFVFPDTFAHLSKIAPRSVSSRVMISSLLSS